MSFIFMPSASAKECSGCEHWDWAKVQYTDLDYKAMDFLWSSWLIPESGKIAILPLTDYSDVTILSTPYGGTGTYAGRRVAESLAYEFTRLGLKPLPYDDCRAAVNNMVAGREEHHMREATSNNAYYLENKSDDMMQALRDSAPGVLSSMKSPSDGAFLSREEIKMLGEILGADLIVRGSLSQYGMQRKNEANWRTFLPPFLGFLCKEKEGMVEGTIYMYDAHSGELIWVVSESVEEDPSLPFFKTNFEIMDSAEAFMALKVVSHLVLPPPPCEWEEGAPCGQPCAGPCGEPGGEEDDDD